MFYCDSLDIIYIKPLSVSYDCLDIRLYINYYVTRSTVTIRTKPTVKGKKSQGLRLRFFVVVWQQCLELLFG